MALTFSQELAKADDRYGKIKSRRSAVTNEETLLLEALSALALLIGELDSGHYLGAFRRVADLEDLSALSMAVNRGRMALRAIRQQLDEPPFEAVKVNGRPVGAHAMPSAGGTAGTPRYALPSRPTLR